MLLGYWMDPCDSIDNSRVSSLSDMHNRNDMQTWVIIYTRSTSKFQVFLCGYYLKTKFTILYMDLCKTYKYVNHFFIPVFKKNELQ